MIIEVYNLTQEVFDKRVLLDKKYINFYQLLEALGMINNGDGLTNGNNQNDLENIIDTKDTLVISTSDMSSLHSHVFERLEQLFTIIEEDNWFKYVVINSPSKPLLNALSRIDDVQYKNDWSYEKPLEKDIIHLKNNFDENILGQESAKETILRKLVGYLIRPTDKPLILMFYGNPGVGKTETAKYLAKQLYKTDNIIIEQMSMAYGENSIKYFKSPNHSGISFAKSLINRTGNLILLDEFSLAPNNIIDSFYQLFDEGIYQDQYFKIDMKNSIIVLTSNVLEKKILRSSLTPALYSRIDGFVKFNDFSENDVYKIIDKIIFEYMAPENMESRYIELIDTDSIKKKVMIHGSKFKSYREIRNFIEDTLSDIILKKIIEKSDNNS